MKYIKTFESLGNMRYKEISQADYSNLVNKFISISDRNMNMIYKIGAVNNIYIDKKNIRYCKLLPFNPMNQVATTSNTWVRELEDEWFILALYNNGYMTYHLCDQIDGLLECLKEKFMVLPSAKEKTPSKKPKKKQRHCG